MSRTQSPITLHKLPHRLEPDLTRVIPRFFAGGERANRRRIERVLSLPEREVDRLLEQLSRDYSVQHPDIADVWLENFARVRHLIPAAAGEPDRKHSLLIGAYFTMEYAVEAAALFNPSIVPSPDQDGLPAGSTRFLMTLRATGEGHLSSIVFRRGVIDQQNFITIEAPSPLSRVLHPVPDAEFGTDLFRHTLADLGLLGPLEDEVLDRIGSSFSLAELGSVLRAVRPDAQTPASWDVTSENMLTLARSNHMLAVPDDADASQMVIFPTSDNESRGIEDLRAVCFTDEDGRSSLYGTYTAYNGYAIFPTLMHTRDFRQIEVHTMSGRYARNKGMALFPRKVNGRYVMSGRLDGENLYVLDSDNVLVWSEGRMSQEPAYWWEYAIIGNCGSPVETDEGWLLLTHGVGPMRQYSIGAVLLDLDDPSRVIGRLREPLIVPEDDERMGYVPNVVYTCGAMLHNDVVLIPYAVSDRITRFAYAYLCELLDELQRG